ncbi:MAG: hypothetical protein MUC50_09385 [Myxococcota bacterium]|nr:hypothetical protein [Myxococcota bacterium]
MNVCHLCGAAMRDDERVCPTCGSSTAADPYSPGHALVAEVENAPSPAGPSTSLDYGVKMELEAVLSDRHRAAARPL